MPSVHLAEWSKASILHWLPLSLSFYYGYFAILLKIFKDGNIFFPKKTGWQTECRLSLLLFSCLSFLKNQWVSWWWVIFKLFICFRKERACSSNFELASGSTTFVMGSTDSYWWWLRHCWRLRCLRFLRLGCWRSSKCCWCLGALDNLFVVFYDGSTVHGNNIQLCIVCIVCPTLE